MFLLAIALSVLVGVSLGALGGGGSILTLPILLYVLHLEEQVAIATSLLVVGVTSLAAVVTHARAGNVDWKTGFVFATGSAAGAFLGGMASAWLPAVWLLRGFLLMMLGTGIAMIRERPEVAAGTFSAPKALGTGFLLGGVTGLVGAGGGFVVVPALVLVGGLPMKRAVGTSLIVIAVQALSGFIGHATHVTLDYPTAAGVTAAAAVGSVFGGRVAARVPAPVLGKVFGWFVLGMAAFMAYEQA